MIVELQNNLIKRLQETFKGLEYHGKTGLRPLNIISQEIPESRYESDEEIFPYILVRILEGEDSVDPDENSETNIVMIICTYDEGEDQQGHKDTLNIINKIRLDLLSDPNISPRFKMVNKLLWALNEEELDPFYVGWVSTDWEHKGIMLQENEHC